MISSPTAMRSIGAIRSAILGCLILLLLISITYNYSSEPRSLFFSSDHLCRIWPDWEDSTQVKKCDGTFTSLIGDAASIGNPHRCLSATSRFEQYVSPYRMWSEVRWGQVQNRCRSGKSKSGTNTFELLDTRRQHWSHQNGATTHASSSSSSSSSSWPFTKAGRTAVVLRTWDDYKYTKNRLAWLRALIAEVSLRRENGYDVFLLVNVKNKTVDLHASGEVYERIIRHAVPQEFRDIAILFNAKTLEAWYPKVDEHGAQDQMYQALQVFSQQFPQYEYIWQLEMDLRFTGHAHDTLDSAAKFARSQGRRNLWERNGRFYIPELYDHSFEQFTEAVDAEMGDGGVWGPVATRGFAPKGPEPPPRSQRNWGVGEEADLISLMPMIDPIGTEWVYEDSIVGFADDKFTPRRVAIISITRASRRLLQLVHEAQRDRGQWLVSEATLETFSLLHGLKAVTIPHPISFTGQMTAKQLNSQIHKGPANSRAGGKEPSLFYTRTRGFLSGPWWVASYFFTGDGPKGVWDAYVAGRGIPPMIIHPVKEE